jgi:hypothetical protein
MAEELKNECNHKGKWLGLGSTIINLATGFLVVHNLFCSECGETKIVPIKIPFPEESPIARPELDLKGLYKGKKLTN